MLIGDEDCRATKRPLAQYRSCRCSGPPAQRHRQIAATRKHVDRIDIHETTAIVSDIDHDSLSQVIISIEIDV